MKRKENKIVLFLKRYPKLSIALSIFILSLFSIFYFKIKLGTELQGGVIVQLKIPGYTVVIEPYNVTELSKIPGIIIYAKTGTNRYEVIVFKNQSLSLLKKYGKIIKYSPGLPMEYITDKIKPVVQNRLNSLGISEVRVLVWKNQYLIIEGPISIKKDLNKILQLGVFEIRVKNQTVLTGSDIIATDVHVFKGPNGDWEVSFLLTAKGAKKLQEVMAKYGYNANISMVFDNAVIFSGKPAYSLVNAWKSGKLVTNLVATGFGTDDTYWVTVKGCSVKNITNTNDFQILRIENNNTIVVSSTSSKSKIVQDLEKQGCQVTSVLSAMEKAKELALALRSGSLPIKMQIVSTYIVEPVLAKQIRYAVLIIALAAVLGVFIVLTLRYRKPILSLPIFLTMLMEVVIILGAAAIVNWVIDLSSIIGILMVVASGIDDQLVILDETKIDKKIHKAIQGAFFIIYVSAFTLCLTISPLFGIYQFRGFAFTTILGVLIGVFITRPAYAEIVEKYISKKI